MLITQLRSNSGTVAGAGGLIAKNDITNLPFVIKHRGVNELKGLFKDSLIATLPANVLNKPKQGFMVPVGRWIKEDLKDKEQYWPK